MRSRHLAVVLSMIAGILLLPGTPAHATWPGDNGRIVFWDFMSGQVYAVNPDGTGLAQLTHTPEGRTASEPRWSPDSTHIVFESDMGGPPRIWIMDATGGDQHQIVGDHRGFADLSPSFTPNGRQGRIDLVHVNVPDHDYTGVSKGWKEHYWRPWRRFLARRKGNRALTPISADV